jgi:hypothetical protein
MDVMYIKTDQDRKFWLSPEPLRHKKSKAEEREQYVGQEKVENHII